MANLDELMEEARFRLTLHDIAEPLQLEEPAAIFNLACPASPEIRHCFADISRATAVPGHWPGVPLDRWGLMA
jgi:hypothetical protein